MHQHLLGELYHHVMHIMHLRCIVCTIICTIVRTVVGSSSATPSTVLYGCGKNLFTCQFQSFALLLPIVVAVACCCCLLCLLLLVVENHTVIICTTSLSTSGRLLGLGFVWMKSFVRLFERTNGLHPTGSTVRTIGSIERTNERWLVRTSHCVSTNLCYLYWKSYSEIGLVRTNERTMASSN